MSGAASLDQRALLPLDQRALLPLDQRALLPLDQRALLPLDQRASLVARLLALDPVGTGLRLCGAPGPARERFLATLRALVGASSVRVCPAGIDEDRLLGGLDLAASLAAGRPVASPGLLALSDGGLLLVAGAERLATGMASQLASVLDRQEVVAERDGLSLRMPARIGIVLLDEGVEEGAPEVLRDRLAFCLDCAALPPAAAEDRAAVEEARDRLAEVRTTATVRHALVAAGLELGIVSLRPALLALRVCRAITALDGRSETTLPDAEAAAMLVLAHRATRLPDVSPQPDTEAMDQPDAAGAEPPQDAADQDRLDDAVAQVVQAAHAALPGGLLAELTGLAAARPGSAGRVAGLARPASRGRRIGSIAGRPGQGRRLDLVASLRAAAPMQALRRRQLEAPRAGLLVRAADLRVLRCEQRQRATAIFVVDASGSAAMHRMAEAKGAVETLLGECYVRRDQVALIAFRGETASLLLPPTGALTRARRSLAALPGGGGTPLAAGIDAAVTLAVSLRRRGDRPLVVLLTDGRANIARDGARDRAAAQQDAERSARLLHGAGVASLLIDISPRPQPQAASLARLMGAALLALPHSDPTAITAAVRRAA